MCFIVDFGKMFSIPREPSTLLSPGQNFELAIPQGQRVLITDIYVENMGGGTSTLTLLEQRAPNAFEVRYSFRNAAQQVTSISFTTGLRLGDETVIVGNIRIENDSSSQADILPRVNGILVG